MSADFPLVWQFGLKNVSKQEKGQRYLAIIYVIIYDKHVLYDHIKQRQPD